MVSWAGDGIPWAVIGETGERLTDNLDMLRPSCWREGQVRTHLNHHYPGYNPPPPRLSNSDTQQQQQRPSVIPSCRRQFCSCAELWGVRGGGD